MPFDPDPLPMAGTAETEGEGAGEGVFEAEGSLTALDVLVDPGLPGIVAGALAFVLVPALALFFV